MQRLSGAAIAALISGVVAWKLASAEAQSSAASGSTAADGLAEVTVTAERVQENLQRAAIAVSAVGGDQLRDAGVTRPTELTAVVPSLQVATSAGPYNLFYLRGVGNFNGDSLSDAALAFNVDGVYIGRPSSTTGFFYDLDRVEVVKGPQGTLYGRNATGGAINVVSKKPELGELGGNITGEWGNYDALRFDGALNIPLGDKMALRAAAIRVQHDGYMSDGTDDQKDTGARLSFRAEPTDQLSILVVSDYFDQGGKGVGSTVIANNSPLPAPAPAIDIDSRWGLGSPQAAAFYQSQPNSIGGRTFAPPPSDPYMDNTYWGVSSTIDWRTDLGTLTVIPAYRDGRLNFLTTTPGFQILQREDDRQKSLEARFASSQDHAFRYLLGAFYYDETNDTPLYNVNSQFNASYQDFNATTESKAVFGRLTYAFTKAFRVNAGARWTTEDKTFSGTFLSNNRICIFGFMACPTATPYPYDSMAPVLPGPPSAAGTIDTLDTIVADERLSVNRTTWRVGADWDISDHNLLYASYETGFKAGGFFFSNDQGTFKPESIRAYTLGSKNRFLDNRLELNVELFRWKYTDQQISHLSVDSKGAVIWATENVGAATLQGGEIELKFRPVSSTVLSADVQYLDAVYDDFRYSVPNLNNGAANGTACPNDAVLALVYLVNCSGFRPPNAPQWTANAGVQQTFALRSFDLVANVRGHFQTKTLTGLEFTQGEVQDAYATLDASLTLDAPRHGYFVTAFVNNAFDKTVIGNTFPPPLSFFTVGSLRPPRTYGIRVGARFGE